MTRKTASGMSAPEKPGVIAATAGVWVTFQRRTYQVYGYRPHDHQSAAAHFHRNGDVTNVINGFNGLLKKLVSDGEGVRIEDGFSTSYHAGTRAIGLRSPELTGCRNWA